MAYLLDADWVIQALANRTPAITVLHRLKTQRIGISAVTVGEIYEGAFNTSNSEAHIERFRRFLQPYRVLDVTEPIMWRFTEIRSYLRRRGTIIPDFDISVGATALHYDLTVLTFNTRHLARIPSLRLYAPS